MTLAEIERAWPKPALDLTPATQGGFLIELATVRLCMLQKKLSVCALCVKLWSRLSSTLLQESV